MDSRAGAVRGTAEMLCRHGDVKSFPPDAPVVVSVFLQNPFIREGVLRSRSSLTSVSVAIFSTLLHQLSKERPT